ncbi:MAG: hypothetical protein ABW219_17620, partial [Ilumatobacteraceae bacterium]
MSTSAATALVCPACEQPVAAGDVFCESCGATLDPAAAHADDTHPPAPAPAPAPAAGPPPGPGPPP